MSEFKRKWRVPKIPTKEEMFQNLSKCVIEGDEDGSKYWAEEVINNNIDAYEAIMEGLAPGMKVVSDRYEQGEYYVPEVLLSASAMSIAVDILRPHIRQDRVSKPTVVVLAVAEGDIHDIGKNLVKIMLDSAGFKVIDLGKDVPVAKVVKAVADNNAQVLGLSALMTTTMTGMKKVIEQLNASGFKGKVKVMIGGAPTSEAFAEQIGADAWAKDASQSVGLVKKLTA